MKAGFYVALALSSLVAIPLHGAAQQAAPSMQDKAMLCLQKTSDTALNPIRNIFPAGTEVTDLMLSTNRVPTKAEATALEWWRTYIRGCLRKIAGPGTSVEAKRLLELEDIELALLAGGRITYAAFALMYQVHADELKRVGAAIEYGRQVGRTDTRPVSGLACTFLSGKLGGLEMIVQFDEDKQTVWADKGGAISSSWVSSTTIGFTQNETTMQISRVSGNFSWYAKDVGVLGSGQCIKATSQKF